MSHRGRMRNSMKLCLESTCPRRLDPHKSMFALDLSTRLARSLPRAATPPRILPPQTRKHLTPQTARRSPYLSQNSHPLSPRLVLPPEKIARADPRLENNDASAGMPRSKKKKLLSSSNNLPPLPTSELWWRRSRPSPTTTKRHARTKMWSKCPCWLELSISTVVQSVEPNSFATPRENYEAAECAIHLSTPSRTHARHFLLQLCIHKQKARFHIARTLL